MSKKPKRKPHETAKDHQARINAHEKRNAEHAERVRKMAAEFIRRQGARANPRQDELDAIEYAALHHKLLQPGSDMPTVKEAVKLGLLEPLKAKSLPKMLEFVGTPPKKRQPMTISWFDEELPSVLDVPGNNPLAKAAPKPAAPAVPLQVKRKIQFGD